jgi:hypothetical protein
MVGEFELKPRSSDSILCSLCFVMWHSLQGLQCLDWAKESNLFDSGFILMSAGYRNNLRKT